VVLAYGPHVDAGDADGVCELWAEDGRYDVGDGWVMHGHRDLRSMIASKPHQGFIHGGSAHFVGPPIVRIDGDRAWATSYSQLVLHRKDPEQHELWRTSANRWELRRTDDGWKITGRTSSVLDGRDISRDILQAENNPTAPPQ